MGRCGSRWCRLWCSQEAAGCIRCSGVTVCLRGQRPGFRMVGEGTKGLSLLLPRSQVEYTCRSGASRQDVSEQGILNKQSFSLEQSGQMMLWINRTSPQSLCLMTFRPKRRASRGRGQTEVGRGPCLTLAMRERCSCEVVCMAARGRDTNTSSRCVSSLAWRRGQLAACCGGTRRAPRCAGDTRCSETAYRETCRVCP